MGEEIAVASAVYNLAGDPTLRPHYLKTLVTGNQFSPKAGGISETLRDGYLHGPAMRLRSFYRWANNSDNYGLVGMPTGHLESAGAGDSVTVEGLVSEFLSEAIWFTHAHALAKGQAGFWVRRWIRENRPEDVDLAWSFSVNAAGDEATLVFAVDDIEIVPLSSPSFSVDDWYLYAYYGVIADDAIGDLEVGEVQELESSESFPSTDGWILVDDDPADTVYRRTSERTAVGDDITATIEYLHLMEETGDRSWRIDTQDVLRSFSQRDYFIFKIGSEESAFDDLINTDAGDQGQFFPFIPIRLDTAFLSDTNQPDAFLQAKKAFKKLTGGSSLDTLIGELEANPDIGDIDHAYVVLGVALNALDNASRRYIYHFFEDLRQNQIGGGAAYADWLAAGNSTVESMPTNVIEVGGTTGLSTSYKIQIEWKFVVAGAGSGLGQTGAKVGDCWIVEQSPLHGVETFRIYWQQTADSYSYRDVVGALHRNFVYGTTAVEITAHTALIDTTESGFIIPLHYDTWRSMPMVQSTQVAIGCVYLVFNCFEVHVQPWWESLFFRIILIIAIAVVSVVFTGGAGIGLLGAHLTLGTALGFSGLTAAIVGSVVNALASMVLLSLLEPLLSGLGPMAPIVSAVLMFTIGSLAGGLTMTGSLSVNWSNLLKVDNLLALTSAVGKGFTTHLNQNSMDLQIEALDFMEKAKRETFKIQQAFFEEFGYGAGAIDPMLFVDTDDGPPNESAATFLTRTLMTGSEIAEMSRELLYEFPKYSLTLPDAFT